MGNANGREEGSENSGADESSEGSNHAPADRAVSTPPHDLHQSRAPLLYSSQAPELPLPRNNGPSFNPIGQYEAQRAVDHPLERGIPTIITWSFGGNHVAVEGSWDNWRTSKTLQRSCKDHSILLVLPSGIFRYRFIMDGEVRYIPDLPTETDEMGRVCNLLDVHGSEYFHLMQIFKKILGIQLVSQLCSSFLIRSGFHHSLLWTMFLKTLKVWQNSRLPNHLSRAIVRFFQGMKNLPRIRCWFHLSSHQVLLFQKSRKMRLVQNRSMYY